MEIAVFVFDGKQVVDQFITLVNPEAKIQPYVSKMTGITENMLRRVPKFYEIAKRIVKITEDCVFVAHNVKFDYRVVQLEFQRLGFDYHRKTLDTIDLAKELLPGLKSYGLETVCDALGITNHNRHRADGDARATVELFRILLEKDTAKQINQMATTVEESENKNPFRERVGVLKNVTGVYYLHNAQGKVLYIGMSRDLQNGINRHFLADNKQAKKLQLAVAGLNVEETGNEAIARMKAFAERQKLKPEYNTESYTRFLPVGLFAETEGKNATFLRIGSTKKRKAEVYFKTHDEALDFVLNLLVTHKVDAETILMEKDFEALKTHLQRHNYIPERKDLPLAAIRKAMFAKPTFLALGPGRHPNEKSVVWIENYRAKGYAFYELDSFLADKDRLKKHLTHLTSHPYIHSLARYFVERGSLKLKVKG
jgi:DNA polymerase-3 subunit epsilon